MTLLDTLLDVLYADHLYYFLKLNQDLLLNQLCMKFACSSISSFSCFSFIFIFFWFLGIYHCKFVRAQNLF